MMNFDFKTLYLVNPCPVSDDSYIRSVHAASILDNAKIFSSFNEACKHIDLLVATSAKETISEKKHLRNPLYLNEFSDQIQKSEGTVGLVFGREDYGLLNEEIAACDLIVKIPTSKNYETLNLSHSVGLVLYSIFSAANKTPEKRTPLDMVEKNHLYDAFSDLLDAIKYPEHKNEKTQLMFKRLMSRSIPSKWEYHTLMGIIRTAAKKIRQKSKK